MADPDGVFWRREGPIRWIENQIVITESVVFMELHCVKKTINCGFARINVKG